MTRPDERNAAASAAATAAASAGRLWSDWDVRGQSAVQDYVKRVMGVPRPRSMTVTIPIAGVTTPPVGFLTSFALFQRVRIVSWLILALVPGTVTLDLQFTHIQADPLTPPVPISLLPVTDPPTTISLNGYSVASYDLSAWPLPELTAPSVLSVFVVEATAIQQAVFALQLADLQGRTLQI